MASRIDRRGKVKARQQADAGAAQMVVRDHLEELARDGACRRRSEHAVNPPV